MKHTFRYLVERDADFAIINAFEKNKEVRKLFLSGYRDLNSIIIETRHSFMQQEVGYGYGESDIIFILEDKKGKYAIFIEDKINADAQPSQRERYEIRAKQLKSKGDFEDYKVFLCAPNSYVNKETKNTVGYENKIPYEAIERVLPEGLDKDILSTVSSGKSCSVVDSGVTNFWKNLRVFVNNNYNDILKMKGKSSDKPSGSMWQEFDTGIKGCCIYLKIDTRKVELEFQGMGSKLDQLNILLTNLNLPTAIRTSKGKSKSASIQFEIPEEYGLTFYSPFLEQENRVIYWLNKAVELQGMAKTLKENNYINFPI